MITTDWAKVETRPTTKIKVIAFLDVTIQGLVIFLVGYMVIAILYMLA